jgi:hypothetical protein
MEREAQEVRGALAKALVTGDPTTRLREFLCELEAKLIVERQRFAAQQRIESERKAAESAASAKSEAVRKFESEHPVATRLIAEAAERRARRAEAFCI